MANGINTSPWSVDDFSGGKTDNYISGARNQFQDATNFVLKKYGNKAKLITRPGSVIYDEDYPRIPANDIITGLAEIESAIIEFNARNAYTIGGSGWETIQGPTGNPIMSSGSASNYLSWAKWNKHLLVTNDVPARPVKIYNNGSNWVARTLGLPVIDTSTVVLTPTAGGNSYVYSFIRADSYTIGTVTFREVSATAVKSVSSAAEPSSGTMAISVLPVLSNSGTGNYATATSKIEIYRTTNGGTTFYYVGEVTNGTTTFNDTVSDATLQTNATLYTEGGVVDYDQAPPSKYVIVTGDTAFYLGVEDTDGTFYGNRVRQSIPGALYASPASFSVDVTQDLTGGGIAAGTPVVFCKNRCYRLEGRYDQFGNGFLTAVEISNTVGCVSHRSIVPTKEGLWFAGEFGFYFTDGFNVRKISGEFNDSYEEIVLNDTTKAQIYGAYDSLFNRVWWAAQRELSNNHNDIVFVAHLDAFPPPFTTLDGGLDADNFVPTALLFHEGAMLRGDRRGYLFSHEDGLTTDPRIDTSTAVVDWDTSTIIYTYLGPAFDFGTEDVRKWVPRIVVNADNVTNLSMQIFSNNDNSGIFQELAEVRYTGNAVWGTPDDNWGDDARRWNYGAVISQWRRFPAGYIRCSYKQVKMTNSYTDIDDYTSVGTASTDATLKTITLDDVTKDWPQVVLDYYISFSSDSYYREYQIIERTSDTVIKVSDPTGSLTTTSARQWRIKGYKRTENFNLLSYVIDYAPITQTQASARTQDGA